jgi:hypothetical protein
LAWLVPLAGLVALGLMWLLLLTTLRTEENQAREAALQQVRGLRKAFETYTRAALRQVDQTARFVAYSYLHQGNRLDLAGVVQQAEGSMSGVIGVFVAD